MKMSRNYPVYSVTTSNSAGTRTVVEERRTSTITARPQNINKVNASYVNLPEVSLLTFEKVICSYDASPE